MQWTKFEGFQKSGNERNESFSRGNQCSESQTGQRYIQQIQLFDFADHQQQSFEILGKPPTFGP